MILGCHVQMKAPLFIEGSVKEALSYGADALMLYTGAPQNTRRRAMADLHVEQAKQLMEQNGIPMEHMIIHAPYIINPANSVKPEVAELAVEFLQQEVQRTKEAGARYLVLHPGSYTTTDLDTGIATAVSQLNKVNVPEGVVICLETMAGKGSEIGYRFEQLVRILEQLEQPERYGVCFDTCHTNDAGYDLEKFDDVLDEFDHLIGLERLHVVHLNDSKNIRGARKDRHANLGRGTIGFDLLHRIAVSERLQDVPKILETPYINEKPPYGYEIEMLRSGVYRPEILDEM